MFMLFDLNTPSFRKRSPCQASSKTAYFVHRLGLNYEPLIPSFIGETKVHNKRGSPITVPCKITLCGNCTRPKRNVSEFHDYFSDWKWKSVTDPRKFFYTNRGLCNHTSGKSLKLDLDFAFRQASDTQMAIHSLKQ